MRALRFACLLVVSCLLVFTLAAQSTPAPAENSKSTGQTEQASAAEPKTPGPVDKNSLAEGAPPLPPDLQQVVRRQFGPSFKVAFDRVNTTKYLHPPEHVQEWSPLLVGDLDGDGIEDAVIVARVKNVFSGQIPFNYAVIDPYFAAYGSGNPKVTAGLWEERPEGDYVVLTIHGAGPEGWRNPVPKAKFVMINLPFNTINVAPVAISKKGKPLKQVSAIILEEDGSNESSIVTWDGKKYKWKDMGGPGE